MLLHFPLADIRADSTWVSLGTPDVNHIIIVARRHVTLTDPLPSGVYLQHGFARDLFWRFLEQNTGICCEQEHA